MKINQLASKIHKNAIDKGFWKNPKETGTLLMLCVSELSEALEADRKENNCNLDDDLRLDLNDPKGTSPDYCKKTFELYVKDTFEDELADTMIRIMDLAASRKIDLEWHIEQKMKYNSTRKKLHGKKY